MVHWAGDLCVKYPATLGVVKEAVMRALVDQLPDCTWPRGTALQGGPRTSPCSPDGLAAILSSQLPECPVSPPSQRFLSDHYYQFGSVFSINSQLLEKGTGRNAWT